MNRRFSMALLLVALASCGGVNAQNSAPKTVPNALPIDPIALSLDTLPIAMGRVIDRYSFNAAGDTIILTHEDRNAGDTVRAWHLPDGKIVPVPDKADRQQDANPALRFISESSANDKTFYTISPPNEASWQVTPKEARKAVGYSAATQRFYYLGYFRKRSSEKASDLQSPVYSIARGEKKARLEAHTDNPDDEAVLTPDGKLLLASTKGFYQLKNAQGQVLYRSRVLNHETDGFFNLPLESTFSVTPDGKRFIFQTKGFEQAVVRISDGAELLHILQPIKYSRAIIEQNGHYVGYLIRDIEDRPHMPASYRFCIATVPDEPGQAPKIQWLYAPSAEKEMEAELKVARAAYAEYKTNVAAEEAKGARLFDDTLAHFKAKGFSIVASDNYNKGALNGAGSAYTLGTLSFTLHRGDGLVIVCVGKGVNAYGSIGELIVEPENHTSTKNDGTTTRRTTSILPIQLTRIDIYGRSLFYQWSDTIGGFPDGTDSMPVKLTISSRPLGNYPVQIAVMTK